MLRPFFYVLGLGVCIIATLSTQAQPKSTAPAFSPDEKGFDKNIAPFLTAHCTRCHNDKKQEGKLNLANLSAKTFAEKAKLWQRVGERVRSGEMPPEGSKRPSEQEVTNLTKWLDGELVRAGEKPIKKVNESAPQFGNKLNHDDLFSVKARTIPDAPPRVWRISPYIYENFVTSMGYKNKLPNPFSLPAGHEFKDYAALNGIDDPTSAQMIRNAEAVTALRLKQGSKEIKGLLEGNASTSDLEKAIVKTFQDVTRRSPTSDETKRFLNLIEKNIAEAGKEEGIKAGLAAIMLVPEAYYRSEMGEGKPNADGLVKLSQREIAFALSYAIGDAVFQPALIAAEKGQLGTKEQIVAMVEQMYKDQKFQKTRTPRFFREYFGYHQATEVFKDAAENKDHEARLLVSDTDRLIEHILQNDKDVFKTLLTTQESFVACNMDFKTKKIVPAKKGFSAYNLTPEQFNPEQPQQLPKEQRAGILTQPSWLVAWSANTENHAILRGKWVRERLLGGYMPDLPITVDAQLPNEPKQTLRERMSVTKEAYCWNCHQRMNDLGLAFESYDHFGRHRTTELGKPVDSTGLIAGSGDPKLDGPVKNALEMTEKLANSDRVRQVFIRHAFRYWMGRNETLGDAWTLVQADKTYQESGGSMKTLIASILTSESFLYRRVKETR